MKVEIIHKLDKKDLAIGGIVIGVTFGVTVKGLEIISKKVKEIRKNRKK